MPCICFRRGLNELCHFRQPASYTSRLLLLIYLGDRIHLSASLPIPKLTGYISLDSPLLQVTALVVVVLAAS